MENESNASCTCEGEGSEVCLCPLEGIMEIISKKWSIHIIGVIGNHKRLRYNKIMEKLEGISPKSLSDRLKDLEAAGLVKREAFAEIPPRVEYTLTRDGEELRDAIIPLMNWVNSRT
ncbi:putative HTH-type transcriptional regulator YybR [archaeon BMS3Abin16]|nr:putative HTH-type transcriptional regulator YybR [archaeon BMS3Abin16]HDY74080.1 transcriptional regulator [Euryarchaeota archaeon]